MQLDKCDYCDQPATNMECAQGERLADSGEIILEGEPSVLRYCEEHKPKTGRTAHIHIWRSVKDQRFYWHIKDDEDDIRGKCDGGKDTYDEAFGNMEFTCLAGWRII